MILFNEWIIIRALLGEGPGVQNVMTMLVFKECMGIYIRDPSPLHDAGSGVLFT